MSNFIYKETDKFPIKAWIKGVPLEAQAEQQLKNIAQMPFIHKHVAVMPDVHFGKGATVGTVIATKKAIIPAAVGVDIGCGMMAAMTSLKASDLPDNLHTLRCEIERAVPHGRSNNGGKGDKGAFTQDTLPTTHEMRWKSLWDGYNKIAAKHPKAIAFNTWAHMGTLGGGNHFIELCLDEQDNVWVILHSGSRGVGNKIGMYFIEKAKEEMEKYHIIDHLPDQDLAYLVENTVVFDDYVEAVSWAQEYARHNREAMMEAVVLAMRKHLKPFTTTEVAVNCHHNYIEKEYHFGENVWVTRKGAVRARKTDLGIIPGSMGTGSFIVRGLGNEQSFCSCSHGAGRVMSRGQAKKLISMDDHKAAMKGIEARTDEGVLDESPAAYKDIGAVMEAQSDLVEILYKLRQVLNVKG